MSNPLSIDERIKRAVAEKEKKLILIRQLKSTIDSYYLKADECEREIAEGQRELEKLQRKKLASDALKQQMKDLQSKLDRLNAGEEDEEDVEIAAVAPVKVVPTDCLNKK